MLICVLAGVVYEDKKKIKRLESSLDIFGFNLADQIKKRIKDDCNDKEEKQKKESEDWTLNCPN